MVHFLTWRNIDMVTTLQTKVLSVVYVVVYALAIIVVAMDVLVWRV